MSQERSVDKYKHTSARNSPRMLDLRVTPKTSFRYMNFQQLKNQGNRNNVNNKTDALKTNNFTQLFDRDHNIHMNLKNIQKLKKVSKQLPRKLNLRTSRGSWLKAIPSVKERSNETVYLKSHKNSIFG
mmetsp:Transcript_23655/g.21021  ORF Transcript_23655/g.21021 Transcript_23655/m.21021 type:complete len:128 (-) Transcript_23655:41-424(-)